MQRSSSLDDLNSSLPFDLFDPLFSAPYTLPSPSQVRLQEAMNPSFCTFDIGGPEPNPDVFDNILNSIGSGDLPVLDAYDLENLLPVCLDNSMASDPYGEPSNLNSLNSYPSFSDRKASTPEQQAVEKSQRFASSHKEISSENNNLLLITIPSRLSNAPVLNSIPTLQVNPVVVNQIKETSAGHDGIFLPQIETFSIEEVTRRAPLQIIQQVVNVNKPQPSFTLKPSIPGKRKQQFNVMHDDMIIFTDELKTPKRRGKVKSYLEDSFEWNDTPSDIELDKTFAGTSVDNKQQCPGCQKVFVKLSHHKCKKMTSSELAQRLIRLPSTSHSELKCPNCFRFFRLESSFANHVKSCDLTTKLLFCDFCGLGFRSKSGIKRHLTCGKRCNQGQVKVKKESEAEIRPAKISSGTKSKFEEKELEDESSKTTPVSSPEIINEAYEAADNAEEKLEAADKEDEATGVEVEASAPEEEVEATAPTTIEKTQALASYFDTVINDSQTIAKDVAAPVSETIQSQALSHHDILNSSQTIVTELFSTPVVFDTIESQTSPLENALKDSQTNEVPGSVDTIESQASQQDEVPNDSQTIETSAPVVDTMETQNSQTMEASAAVLDTVETQDCHEAITNETQNSQTMEASAAVVDTMETQNSQTMEASAAVLDTVETKDCQEAVTNEATTSALVGASEFINSVPAQFETVSNDSLNVEEISAPAVIEVDADTSIQPKKSSVAANRTRSKSIGKKKVTRVMEGADFKRTTRSAAKPRTRSAAKVQLK